MDRKREIFRYSLSIVVTSLFLIFATYFIFFPKQRNMVGALSFLRNMNDLSFEEISDDLSLSYNFPIPDEMGKDLSSYEFKVVNHGSHSIQYQLSLFTGDDAKKIPQNALRYMIQKNGEDFSEIQTLSDDGEIAIDVIDGKTANNYALKFWVHTDVDSDILGKTFQGIVSLTAVK